MKQIAVDIKVTVFIDANKLKLYKIDTGEEKYLSEIPDIKIHDTGFSDPNWILASSVATMRDGQCEYEAIRFEDITS